MANNKPNLEQIRAMQKKLQTFREMRPTKPTNFNNYNIKSHTTPQRRPGNSGK